MKKVLLGVLGVVVVLVGSAAVVMVPVFAGLKPVDPSLLPNGVISVQDGYVQAFLVPEGDGKALLIDCGQDPEAKAIKAVLAAKQLTVNAIFLTHGHVDHLGGCNAFPEAELYAFEAERALMTGTGRAKGPLPGRMDTPAAVARAPSKVLTEGTAIDLGTAHVEPFLIPGHTAGSAAFLVNEVLFLGDSAAGQNDGEVRAAPWPFSDDVAQSRASVASLPAKLTGRPVKALAFAHSGALLGLEPLARFKAVP